MSETATKPEQRTDDEWVFRYGWRTVTRPGPDGRMESVQVPLTREDYIHPQEGDHFMITEAHDEATIYLRNALRRVTRGLPGVKVLRDHRTDFQVGNIRPMGPDVILLTGDPEPWPTRQGTYPVADRGATPMLVIEVTSPSTRKDDMTLKVTLYHAASVRIYVLVDEDPNTQDWYLLCYRHTPDGYVRFEPDARGWLWLEAARVWLAAEGNRVRLYTEAGVAVPDYEELDDANVVERERSGHLESLNEDAILARQQAEREAREAQRRAADAEAKLRDALAEIERLKGGS